MGDAYCRLQMRPIQARKLDCAACYDTCERGLPLTVLCRFVADLISATTDGGVREGAENKW